MKLARLSLDTPIVRPYEHLDDLPSPQFLLKNADKLVKFGKREVEIAAVNLLLYLDEAKGGWSSFKLEDYLAWHQKHAEKGIPPLFGILCGWLDSGFATGPIRYSKRPLLIVDENGDYAVTKYFVLRCLCRK